MLVWAVWMSRWNESSPTYGYCIGLTLCPDKARKLGRAEEKYRGGKYGFQDSPCHIDDQKPQDSFMENVRKPGKYFVASVRRKKYSYSSEYDIQHFLGVYTTEKLAIDAGKNIYPGWEVITDLHEITEKDCKQANN